MRGELAYPGGVRAIVEASTVDDVKLRRTLVAGDTGTLVFDELAVERGVAMYRALEADDPFAAIALSDSVRSFGVPAGEAMAAEARHFVDAIATGHAPTCNAADGRRTVGILDGATDQTSAAETAVRAAHSVLAV